jgi:hypothetical protein
LFRRLSPKKAGRDFASALRPCSASAEFGFLAGFTNNFYQFDGYLNMSWIEFVELHDPEREFTDFTILVIIN